MRVCVIGAGGQLGFALVDAFAAGGHDVLPAVRRDPRPGQVYLDLADAASVRDVLQAIGPDVIAVAGAMCHVDACEADPAACAAVNVTGTGAVVEWARHAGARVVFYSTDHVFDGTAAENGEEDPVEPLNEYARSKVAVERLLRDELPERHLVLRTAWLYGPDPARRNFALRLVARLRAGERVTVPSDQWGAPTYTADVAAATRHLVERGEVGTFHAAGPDLVDRTTLAHVICTRFDVDPAGIVPTETAALHQPARRPLRVRLRCGRLTATGAPSFRGIDAGLAALRRWAEPRPVGAIR